MSKPNLQTVIVSKDLADTRAEATEIAREFANRIYTSRETKNTWRFRQRPPKDFKKGTFRTFKVPGTDGVSMVYGTLKNPRPRWLPAEGVPEVRRWERDIKRAKKATNLKDLAEIAKEGRGWMDSPNMLAVFDHAVVKRARDFGVECGDSLKMVEECVDRLIENQDRTLFTDIVENPKRKKVPKNPKVLPDPGDCAWLGTLLEWAWFKRKNEFLWEPDGAWAFLWSPRIKGVIGIPDPTLRNRLSKVSRRDGAAKLFERFTSRDASNTYEIEIPRVKLQKLGRAGHIVYRSDKWNPGTDIDYIHDFKDGVQLFVGPTLEKPEVFLCFGGRLTCTERGLVY
jgi:hypothetical protein